MRSSTVVRASRPSTIPCHPALIPVGLDGGVEVGREAARAAFTLYGPRDLCVRVSQRRVSRSRLAVKERDCASEIRDFFVRAAHSWADSPELCQQVAARVRVLALRLYTWVVPHRSMAESVMPCSVCFQRVQQQLPQELRAEAEHAMGSSDWKHFMVHTARMPTLVYGGADVPAVPPNVGRGEWRCYPAQDVASAGFHALAPDDYVRLVTLTDRALGELLQEQVLDAPCLAQHVRDAVASLRRDEGKDTESLDSQLPRTQEAAIARRLARDVALARWPSHRVLVDAVRRALWGLLRCDLKLPLVHDAESEG